METNKSSETFFLKTHITVQAASDVLGHKPQYLRRLFREKPVKGDKIGQTWLIRKTSLETY
jgi:hypothetical protein